jgi:hypothetical protein
LNLPIMMVPGTGDMVKDVKSEFDGKKWVKESKLFRHSSAFFCRGDLTAPPDGVARTRRRSIYNFFLRHQDAVDDHNTSPSVHKKVMKPSETIFSLKGETPTSPPQKSKRATSFIKKKPRLERGLSDQSVLRLNRNATLGEVSE